MNKKYIILSLLVLAFVGIGIYSMRGFMTPYVSFKSAIQTQTYVQLIGKINKNAPMHQNEGVFLFSITDDENTILNIAYRGIKPANFEHADKVVALGIYNAAKKIFDADKILVKCPSKYVKE